MLDDKAPGPDRFTGHFYRTTWPIIKGMSCVCSMLFGFSQLLLSEPVLHNYALEENGS
jgi:hypothetical protein